jgi:hypothetical protein
MVIATYSLIVYLTNAQLEGRLSQQIITIYWGAAGWLTAVLLLGGYHQTLGQFQREIRERLDAS